MNVASPDEEKIFYVARGLGDPEAREAYLRQVCRGDGALLGRVEALLRISEQEASFLEVPPYDATVEKTDPVEALGTMIGPYKLMEQIGEGGMGVVFVAEQHQPVRRKVALKIIKPGMDSRQVIARFEAERQALALMDHPNIARVFDGGTTDAGRPYFVMELVRGLPITDYCDAERLSIRGRLELFVLVCRAVQHAHQKGIIHRDLKPSNILVTLHDGVPVPKVIDFGVAKATGVALTERTLYTGFHQLLGTPLYMSPEQFEMSGLDVDTRSDIYSLGVLLYELLTGTTPFDSETLTKAAFDELRRIIREEEPPSPSTRLSTLGEALRTTSAKRSSDSRRLDRSVRGELDWIVMRALEKDRRRRYETANDFAADVLRHLTEQPVEACPPSARYRFQKFAQRNRAVLTTAALVVAALCVGIVVSTWQAVRANQAEGRAESQQKLAESQRKLAESSAAEARQQTNEARKAQSDTLRAKQEAERQRIAVSQNLYFADMRLGPLDWADGNIGRLSSKLISHAPRVGDEDRRGWEWYYLLALSHQDERTLLQHVDKVGSLDWSPDGRRLASTGWDMKVTVYDTTTWQPLQSWQGYHAYGAHWSPDSQHLAWATHGPDNGLYVGHMEAGETSPLLDHWFSRVAPAWSPDGKRLASRGRSGLRLWDPVTGSSVGELNSDISFGAMAWDTGGKLRVLAHDGRTLLTWDAVSGGGSRAVPLRTGMSSAAWSPDGRRLALGMETGKCLVYETTTWSMAHEWDAHCGPIRAVAWHPDGTQLASAGADHLIRVREPATGRDLRTLRGHRNQVVALAWEPNGRRLASGGMDGLVKVWQLSSAPQPLRLEGHAGGVRALAWTEDGQTLRSLGAADGVNALWSAVNGRRLAKAPAGRSQSGRFSPGGRLLAIAAGDERRPEVSILDAVSREMVQSVKKVTILATFSAFSPDASKLAISDGAAVEVVDLRRGEPPVRWECRGLRALSWSPDGRLLAAAGNGDVGPGGHWGHEAYLHVFDIKNRRRLLMLSHGRNWVPATAVAWSPNGQRVISGDLNGLVEIWDVPTGHKVASVQLHTAAVNALAWSPDGRRVASGSVGRAVIVWDPTRGEELLRLDAPESDVTHLEWSPNGRRLAGATADGAILIWDATVGYEFIQSETYFFEQVQYGLNHASQLWESGRKDEALAAFEQTVGADKSRLRTFPPWVGMSFQGRAVIASRTGQNEEAIALYQLLARLAEDAGVQEGLGDALREQGRTDEAIAAYRQAIRIGKGSPATYHNTGVAFADKNQWDDAVASFRDAVRLGPQAVVSRVNLGLSLLARGQPDEAIAAFREALRLSKDDYEVHMHLGEALHKKYRLEEAIAALREALRLKRVDSPNRDDAPIYNCLGDALQTQGRSDEAIASYRQAILLNKGDAILHANLGKALHAKGQPNEALTSFHEAIRLDKNLADAHSNLGISLLAGGLAGDAIAALRESLRLKNHTPGVRNENPWTASFGENTLECDLINLGNALYAEGRSDEAGERYQEATRHYQQFTRPRRGPDATPHHIMARFLATCPESKFRAVAQAVDLAKEAVKLAPSAYRAQSALGVCLYRAGDWKAAIEALEKLEDLRQGGDSFDWFFRAMALWQIGQRGEAREWYDRAVECMDRTQPRNPELRRLRAEADELLGVGARQR